ncbi:hypothetical protein [Candidatus Protofrankia californiensis]|nr:hypothetical protein [Candidatus Protofrankia californiensis]
MTWPDDEHAEPDETEEENESSDESHVRSILAKPGCTERAELITRWHI